MISMNKILFFAFFLFFCFPVYALDVEGIRFGVHPDKTRIVIETSEEVDFRSFVLSEPTRLIVDLPLFVWQAGAVSPPPSAQVTNVRYAVNQPGISRIVFDLGQHRSIKNAFQLPPLQNGHSRIVIDLTSQHLAAEAHGNLDTASNNHQTTTQTAEGTFLKPLPKPKPMEKPLVVIDPGHGGTDPGAISPQNLYEKNIVLSLSKELKKSLEENGYRVKMTRDTDVYIKLGNRVRLSREWGADMFISVHADSIRNKNIRGASVYTLSNKASDAQTEKLAQRENRSDIIAGVDLTHEDKVVSDILIDLAMRDTMNQSRFFANLIVDSFKKHNVRALQNTHRYAGFAVLKAPDVPSVLIEAGFLSNRTEANNLTKKSYRSKIIQSIVYGVDSYFEKTRG